MEKKVAREKSSWILLAIWGGVIAIALSVTAGILLGQSTIAARRKGTQLNKWDRTTYGVGKGGKNTYKCGNKTIDVTRGAAELNLTLNCRQYYQPVPQEYGLGYLSNASKIERLCSSKIYPGLGNNVVRSTSAECFTKQTKKNYQVYVDHYRSASYMGDLYDVREYFWAAYRATNNPPDGACEVRIGASANIHVGAMGCWIGDVQEFHFYPRGSLAELDKYKYEKVKDLIEVPKDTPGDLECVTDKVTKIETCYYDLNAFRDENEKIYYTGTYTNEETGEVLTAKEYEARLVELENSIHVTGQEMGVFKGYIRFSDIDWYAESYLPARGAKYIFTTAASNILAESVLSGKKHGNWDGSGEKNEYRFCYSGSSCTKTAPTWYEQLCPASIRNDSVCKYNYHGSAPSTGANRNTSIWVAFESTSEEPFTLVYQVQGGWGSGASSESVSVAYVLLDDTSTLPDGIQELKNDFNEEYTSIYGKDLAADDFIRKQSAFTADQVLRKFQISQYADFDPYTINELLEDVGVDQLVWYNCPNLKDDCRIPNKRAADDTSDKITVNSIPYYYHDLNDSYYTPPVITANSVYHDFMTEDRVYYATINIPMPVDFPNTCYSDNVSTGEINQ